MWEGLAAGSKGGSSCWSRSAPARGRDCTRPRRTWTGAGCSTTPRAARRLPRLGRGGDRGHPQRASRSRSRPSTRGAASRSGARASSPCARSTGGSRSAGRGSALALVERRQRRGEAAAARARVRAARLHARRVQDRRPERAVAPGARGAAGRSSRASSASTCSSATTGPAPRLGLVRDHGRRLAGGEGEPAAPARPVKEVGDGIFLLESTRGIRQLLPRPGGCARARRRRNRTARNSRRRRVASRGSVMPEIVLLTHADFDHSGGASAVRRATGAPVCAPAAERPLLTGEQRRRLLVRVLIRGVNRGRAPRMTDDRPLDRRRRGRRRPGGDRDTGPHARAHVLPPRHEPARRRRRDHRQDLPRAGGDVLRRLGGGAPIDREARGLDLDLVVSGHGRARGREGEARFAGRELGVSQTLKRMFSTSPSATT